MPTQETHLSAFFSSYNSEAYTYDPANSPADEFERLCIAGRWDETRKSENFEAYFLALHENANSPVAVFFCKHSVPNFIHNPLGNQQVEFNRLRETRRWDGVKLKEVREEFEAAAESMVSPIFVFLKGREVAGYRYCSGRAEVEFKKLVGVRRHIWEQGGREMGRDVKGIEGSGRWKVSVELTELQGGFYCAVEAQFDLILDKIAFKTALRRDEVLAELFCVGKAPLAEGEVETVSF